MAPTYYLCRAAFSDDYVARIVAATPPSWKVIQTWRDVTAASIAPPALLVVSGSPRFQKTQRLRIRFGGGAATGAFELPLSAFSAFLESLLTDKKVSTN